MSTTSTGRVLESARPEIELRPAVSSSRDPLSADISRLGELLDQTLERQEGPQLLALVRRVRVDRLSRSSFDFVGLLEAAQRGRWNLVALDVNVDTTTPQGEMMASVMAIFAQLERRLIGQRTRDALAAKKAQGVRLGRPQLLPPDVVERIRSEYAADSVGTRWGHLGITARAGC